MPPKRLRSGTTAVSPSVVGAKSWESGLIAATLEEEFWKVHISWVVTECLEDAWYLSALALAVQQPLRRQFSCISWETTVQKINEMGNPKVKKIKDIPLFHEVMEVAKSTLDAGEEISTELMAKLLKFQLLCLKTSEVQRANERKATEEKSKAKDRSNSSAKGGNKSANKADRGKKNSEAAASVKETKLRRRGEEDESHKYIDDEPDDGPQRYVLLLGFSQPMLLSALESTGVHVSNIIRLNSQDREDCEEVALSSATEDANTILWMPKELNNFWTHLEEIFLNCCNQSRLVDVVCLNCMLEKSLLYPKQDDTEAMLACGAQVFEAIASLIYDSLDWRQEHLHYLNSMKLIDVPSIISGQTQSSPESSAEVQPSAVPTSASKKKQSEDSSDFQPEGLNADVDIRLYCDLLKQIPPESISVPLILHCVLEQVVMSEQGAQFECTASTESEVQSWCNLTDHVISAATNLPRSPEEKKRLMKNFGKLEDVRSDPTGPLLLNYHDKRAERLHQCPVQSNFDVSKTEGEMMKNGPVWNWFHSELSQERGKSCVTQTQELVHLFSDESLKVSDVDWLLGRFVFECMPLSTVDSDGQLTEPEASEETMHILWDDPMAFIKHHYSKSNNKQGLMNINDSSELLKTSLRSLNDWNVLEHFNADVFPQVLQEASQAYRCMDTYRSTRDGSLFIFCHNPMSPQRDSRQLWDVALHTNVGFRIYLEHVASRLSAWKMQEGKSPEASVSPQSWAETSQERVEEIPQAYIQEGSLKALKIEQERLKKEEQMKTAKKDKTQKPTGRGSSRSASAKDNKKTLSSDKIQVEQPEPSQSATPQPGKESEHENTSGEQTAFIGYSMNGSLVHLQSGEHFLYPADGGIIQVETNNFTHGLTRMKICVMKDKHHFFMYYSRLNRGIQHGSFPMKGRLSDHRGSFFAELSTGMKLSLSHPSAGRKGQVSSLSEIPSVALSHQCSQTQSTRTEDIAVPLDSSVSLGSFSQGLHVHTPDGTTVQFIYQDTGDGGTKNVLVRQSSAWLHPSNNSNDGTTAELSRVITSEGTVIRFLRNGSTQILFADGTVSSCQDSEHITQDPLTSENECNLREQNMDSKERKGKATFEIATGNEVDELKKKSEASPAQMCGSWTTTTPSGLQLHTSGDTPGDIHHILTYTSTDPFSQTVVTVREDGVISVQEVNGSKVIEHADGTCITTFYQKAKDGQVNKDMPCRMRRWVMVKKTGFSTVLMGDDSSCHVMFEDGTTIIASCSGSYQIMPVGSGELSINEDGQAIYTSQQKSTTAQTLQPSSYVMSSSADILCHTIDPAGNLFQVKADGQSSVTAVTVQENNIKDHLKTAHMPRLFVAHGDGSGFELLSSQTLEELLLEAYANPAIGVLKEVPPEITGSLEITFLKPSYVNMWGDQKEKRDFISTHLKCRNWDNFPSNEKKTIGPPFGTSLSSSENPWAASPETPPVLSCPEVLLVRQFIQVPSDNGMREHIELVPRSLEDRLPEYIMEYSRQLLSREKLCEDIKLLESRSSDEQEDASHLLQLLLMDNTAVGQSTGAFGDKKY